MRTIIIDGNSVCHAAQNGTKLTVGTMQTQAIFGMLKSVRKLIQKYPGDKILILWDGSADWRYELYPEYKGNREAANATQVAEKDSYKEQSPFVRKCLSLLGVRQMFALTSEADDMAGFFTKRLTASGNQIVLVTRDHDWLQLVSRQVTWFSPIDDYTVTMDNFTKFTGYFSPHAFLEGKALVGDTSDNIAGVDRIGKGTAPKILAEFGSVPNFFKECDSGKFKPKLKIHTNLNEQKGRDIYYRNIKLMNLQEVPAPVSKDIVIIQPAYNEDLFRRLCEKLAFRSITRDFQEFVQPFYIIQ